MDIEYRLLTSSDWAQWKILRLEALKDYSVAFAGSYEEECDREDAFFMSNLENTRVFGAFIDNHLVSTVGLSWNTLIKLNHRGGIFGVYTTSSARGKGIAVKLIEMALEEAKRRKLLWLQLTVWIENKAAVQLYTKMGFKPIGTEIRALRIRDDYFIDQYIMAINLD